MPSEITPTLRAVLDLVGVATVDDLPAESQRHMNNEPLRMVNEQLMAALEQVAYGERAIRRHAHALKTAVDREIANLDEGYALTGWPGHYAAKWEQDRQEIAGGIDRVRTLVGLRRALLPPPG